MKTSQDQETTLKEGSIFLKHDRKHDRLYNYKLCNIFSSGFITIKYIRLTLHALRTTYNIIKQIQNKL